MRSDQIRSETMEAPCPPCQAARARLSCCSPPFERAVIHEPRCKHIGVVGVQLFAAEQPRRRDAGGRLRLRHALQVAGEVELVRDEEQVEGDSWEGQ